MPFSHTFSDTIEFFILMHPPKSQKSDPLCVKRKDMIIKWGGRVQHCREKLGSLSKKWVFFSHTKCMGYYKDAIISWSWMECGGYRSDIVIEDYNGYHNTKFGAKTVY